jgi:hypothetical protein
MIDHISVGQKELLESLYREKCFKFAYNLFFKYTSAHRSRVDPSFPEDTRKSIL